MILHGIEVDRDLLSRWQGWLAPAVQPFFVPSLRSWPKGVAGAMSSELRDTYKVWRLDRSLEVLWLDEETFDAMARTERAALVRSQVAVGRGLVPTVRGWLDLVAPDTLRRQADGHRFVWWPSLIAGRAEQVVARTLAAETSASRHREVAASTWQACRGLLPAAHDLAGSFPPSSGPNCFGTVMGVAGIEGAADEWMVQAPFLDWLRSASRPGGRDAEPGTVLVWRGGDGLPVHAAVTLGGGWAIEKPSQSWSAPRVVLEVGDLIRANRAPGLHLERHRLTG